MYVTLFIYLFSFFIISGSYFAQNASYSHDYTDSTYPNGTIIQLLADKVGVANAANKRIHKMFIARVLCGMSTVGRGSYKTPPSIDPSSSTGPFYDSCVDDMNSANLFVIFDRSQCYPEYIIEYAI